jgi:hypothetical protein
MKLFRVDSLSDSLLSIKSSVIDSEVNQQDDIEIALYDQRFQRRIVVFRQMQERVAAELMEGIRVSQTVAVDRTVNSDSELSTVSSSNFSGSEEHW